MTAEQLATVDLAQVSVRAEPRNLPFRPPDPNSAATWNERDVLWLGPDEWLVVGEAGSEALDRSGSCEDALADGQHRSVLDVSANRVVFELVDGLEASRSRLRARPPSGSMDAGDVRADPLRPGAGDPPPAR